MVLREFLSTFDFREVKSLEDEAEDQHILECQQRRGVEGCGACGHYESCSVIKNRLRARAGLPQLVDGSEGS